MPLDRTFANDQCPPFTFGIKHDKNEDKRENKPGDSNGYSDVFISGVGNRDTVHYPANISYPSLT